MAAIGNKPVLLKNVIARLLEDHGIGKTVHQYLVVTGWEQIVGKQIAEKTEPERVKYNELFVKVKDNAWRHELFYMKQTILENIRKFDKNSDIRDIKFI